MLLRGLRPLGCAIVNGNKLPRPLRGKASPSAPISYMQPSAAEYAIRFVGEYRIQFNSIHDSDVARE